MQRIHVGGGYPDQSTLGYEEYDRPEFFDEAHETEELSSLCRISQAFGEANLDAFNKNEKAVAIKKFGSFL